MTAESIGVTGGVDTHSDHPSCGSTRRGRPAARHTRIPRHASRLPSCCLAASRSAPSPRSGVEGTGCYGAGLTRFLRRRRLRVIEVNRPDRRSRRPRGKSDPLDAESAARRPWPAKTSDPQGHHHDRGSHPGAADRPHRRGEVPHRRLQPAQGPHHHRAGPLRDTLRGKTLQRVAGESAPATAGPDRLADPSQATKLALRSIAARRRTSTPRSQCSTRS